MKYNQLRMSEVKEIYELRPKCFQRKKEYAKTAQDIKDSMQLNKFRFETISFVLKRPETRSKFNPLQTAVD